MTNPAPASHAPPARDRIWMFCFLAWAFLASLGPTIEFDLWFRVRLGEEICKRHEILTYSHFLWNTPALEPYFNPCFDWGFSVLLYLVYAAAGIGLFPCIKSLIVAMLFFINWKSLTRVGLSSPFKVCLLFLVYKVWESRLMLRPQLLTDCALSYLVYLSLSEAAKPLTRRLLLQITAFFALWINLHSAAVIGLPVLFFLFACPDLAERRWPWKASRLAIAGFIGCLLRPYSFQLIFSVFQHVSEGADHAYNLEWQHLTPENLQGCIGVYLALHLLAVVVGARQWWRGCSVAEKSTYLSFLSVAGSMWLLAFLQVRGVGEVAGATPVLLAQVLMPIGGLTKKSSTAVSALIGILLAFGIFSEMRRPDLLKSMPDHLYPDAAIAIIEKEDPQAGIFCSYHFGGYLTFKHLSPFVHGMTTFYAGQRFEDYLALLQSPRAGQLLLDDRIGWALLHYTSPQDAHNNLARRLASGEAGWGLVYFDDSAMLFKAHAAQPFRAIDPGAPNPITGPPEQAQAEIERLSQMSGPNSGWVLELKARLAEMQGQTGPALQLFNQLLTLQPERAAALLGRGTLLFKTGRLEQAQIDLQAYSRLEPDSVIGHFDLALAMASRNERADAKRECQRALLLDPSFEAARKLLNQLGS